jgi:AcrR family transcriptional regulator
MSTRIRLTRQESAALTRRRLLDAARAVFAERGFHGASLEAVAEAAGLTKGAVYSQFESKADLFLALQAERNAATLAYVERALAALDSPEHLSRWLAGYWASRLREGREWTLLLIEFWASACRDPGVLAHFRDQHGRLMVAVGAVLEAAGARLGATLPDAGERLVRATTAIGHGLALEQLLTPEEVDARTLELAFAALLDGDPSPPPRNRKR